MEELFKSAMRQVTPLSPPAQDDVIPDPMQGIIEEKGVVLLDGGCGVELEKVLKRKLDETLWTAEGVVGGEVAEVHKAYVAAGADCVITASYQASWEGFGKAGYSERDAAKLLSKSVDLARDASPKLVAASLGPYAAMLADGSEFDPKYTGVGSVPTLITYHRRKIPHLVCRSPDYLAFETIPCAVEVAVIVALLQEKVCPPAWITVPLATPTTLVSGEPLAEVVKNIVLHDKRGQVKGIGINCTHPTHVTPAIHCVASAMSQGSSFRHIVCYPNAGQQWDFVAKDWVEETATPDSTFSKMAVEWVKAGATVVGGCCQTTPETIRRLREAFDMK